MSVADGLIDIINDLQDVFQTLSMDKQQFIDLPQIVVVGSQSTGKSSVLEALCRRDILPRGTGIVTRCPLILQLNKTDPSAKKQDASDSDDTPTEYGIFSHLPNEMFVEHNEICEEIIRRTEELTGEKKNIVTTPINLKIFSPNVIPLTLVDLPGIINNAGEGQAPDLPQQIKNCVYQFISKKNAIILAVCAANSDLANAEALNAAKTVDPEGERTIGVLTKVDLMDEGTEEDIVKIVNNETPHKLKLGWIAVRNRSQKDVKENKAIETHLEDEANYFKSHEIYKSIIDNTGIQILGQQLNKILIKHIQRKLPELKLKIEDGLEKWSQIAEEYGETPTNPKERLELITDLIHQFCDVYQKELQGHSSRLTTEKRIAAAQIDEYFKVDLRKQIKSITLDKLLTGDGLFMLIENANGLNTDMFANNKVFEYLIRESIKQLRKPTIIAIDNILHLIQSILPNIVQKQIQIYKNLERKILDHTNKLLQEYTTEVNNFWLLYLSTDEFINTNDPVFQQIYQQQIKDPLQDTIDTDDPIVRKLKEKNDFKSQDKQAQLSIIQMVVVYRKYYEVLQDQIYSRLIKTIGHLLITKSQNTLLKSLLNEFHNQEQVNELLTETESIVYKRNEAKKMLNALKRGKEILGKVVNIRTVDDI